MNNFDFLNNIQPVEQEKTPRNNGRVATPKNPTGLRLRVFKDGAVYPSQELVDMFNLEYTNTDAVDSGNGFDVFSSLDWIQLPKANSDGEAITPVLFIASSSKDLPKIDLFGSCKLDNTSVLTQGSKRPELINKLREIYDLPVSETEDLLFLDKNYVDLEIKQDVVVFPGLPAYYIPKKIIKGVNSGNMSYEIRQNLVINPLVIVRD